nr:uncharacterized protein LOC117226448 [Megalopta genalis]
MSYTDKVANFLGSLDTFYESVPQEDLELLVGPVLERMRSQPGSPLSGSPLASRETSPHRVCNMTRHIASSLETSPASSNSASPLPPDTDGEEEEFIDTVETAPERSQKETMKISTSSQKVSNGINVSNDAFNELVVSKENSSELTNGYTNISGYMETVVDSKQERSRQRNKRDEKSNVDFFNQVATTMQNLQRDLDRITARVRSLEGQALHALAPQIRQPTTSPYSKWWPLPECSPRLFAILILWPFIAQFLILFAQRYRQRRL